MVLPIGLHLRPAITPPSTSSQRCLLLKGKFLFGCDLEAFLPPFLTILQVTSCSVTGGGPGGNYSVSRRLVSSRWKVRQLSPFLMLLFGVRGLMAEPVCHGSQQIYREEPRLTAGPPSVTAPYSLLPLFSPPFLPSRHPSSVTC